MSATVPGPGPAPDDGTSVYMRAIRRRWQLIALVTVTALIASLAWLSLRSPPYEATAQVLVSPLSSDTESFVGLPLLRDPGTDPERVLETAATLLRSPRAEVATARKMGPGWDAERVQDSVEVRPESLSSILEVVGSADEAEQAAKLANVYAEEALKARADALEDLVDAALERLRARAAEPQSEAAAADLAARIGELEAIQSGGDPALSLSREATVPTSRAGAAGPIVVAVSLVAGLTLGVAAALLAEMLNRRVRDEDEAVELYDVPVLARVAIVAGGRPAAFHEAYRTVLAQLTANDGGPARTIMVTSGSTGDGKTTSAIGLATAFAGAGHRTLLLDLDLHKPGVARQVGVRGVPLSSLATTEPNGLRSLFRPVPGMSMLSVLATTAIGDPARDGTGASVRADAGALPVKLHHVEMLHERVPLLVSEARAAADFVVVDTPPLGEFSDALRIAHEVDDVIVVVRPGHTDRRAFEVMRDLLNRTANVPVGMLVVGNRPARPDENGPYFPVKTSFQPGRRVRH